MFQLVVLFTDWSLLKRFTWLIVRVACIALFTIGTAVAYRVLRPTLHNAQDFWASTNRNPYVTSCQTVHWCNPCVYSRTQPRSQAQFTCSGEHIDRRNRAYPTVVPRVRQNCGRTLMVSSTPNPPLWFTSTSMSSHLTQLITLTRKWHPFHM